MPDVPTRRPSLRLRAGLGTIAALGLGAAALAGESATVARSAGDWSECITVDPVTGRRTIDADCFLERLRARYRALAVYEDEATLVHETRREDEPARRVETRASVRLEDGRMRVVTPGRVIGGWLRWTGATMRTTRSVDEFGAAYDLWLAPHMSLRLEDDPAVEPSAPTATPDDDEAADASAPATAPRRLKAGKASEVRVGDRSLVRLELERDDAAGCPSSLEMLVDPDSLLVEHVEETRALPDGGEVHATLEIRPLRAEDTVVGPESFEADEPDDELGVGRGETAPPPVERDVAPPPPPARDAG